MSKADYLGLAMQPGGALKTTAPSAVFFPPVTTEGLAISREDMELDETLGSRAPSSRQYGGRVYEGDIEGAVRPNSIPPIFNMFFGSPTSASDITARANTQPVTYGQLLSSGTRLYEVVTLTGGTTGSTPPSTSAVGQTHVDGSVTLRDIGLLAGATIYRHTWDPVAANKRPMPATLWTVNADPLVDIIDKFIGTKGNELTMEVEANGYFLFTAGLAAAQLDETAGAPAKTLDVTEKMAFHQITAEISVAGAALTSIPLQNFSLSFNNNIVTDLFVLGSKEVDDLPDGNIEAEVTFTPTTDIHLHYRRSLKDSPEDVRLVLTARGSGINADALHAKYEVKVDLKRLQYVEAPVEIDASETLRGVEITANPVLNESTGALMEVQVRNTQTGTTYVG